MNNTKHKPSIKRLLALMLCALMLLGFIGEIPRAYATGAEQPAEPGFEAMTVKDMLARIEAKDSFAVVFGFESCPSCQAAMPILEATAGAAGMSVGYVDTRENPEWQSNLDIDDYDELAAALGQYFELVEDGRQHLYVPHVFFIRDGEVVLQHQGLADGAEPESMTAEQAAQLAAIYAQGFRLLSATHSEDEFVEPDMPKQSTGCDDCGTRAVPTRAVLPPWDSLPTSAIQSYVSSAGAKLGTVTTFTYDTALYDLCNYPEWGWTPPRTATATVYLPHGYNTADAKDAYNLMVVFGGDLDSSSVFIDDAGGDNAPSIKGRYVYDYVFAQGLAEPFIIIQLDLTGWVDKYDSTDLGDLRDAAAWRDVQTAIDYADANYKTYAALASSLTPEQLAECSCVTVGHYSYAGHSRGAVFVDDVQRSVPAVDWTLWNFDSTDGHHPAEWRHEGDLIASSDDEMHSDNKFLLSIANALQLFDDSCDCPLSGEAYVLKTSSNPELTNGNSCYSLAGAMFKIYSSRNDAIADRDALATLGPTNAQGKSDAVELAEGDYYLKETVAPSGFALNPNPVPFTVVAGETTEIQMQDAPKSDPVGVLLKKVDAITGEGATRG